MLRQRAEKELIRAKEALELKTVELAHSLSMMRATLESTTDGILVTDDDGNVTGFNEKYVNIWQIPRDVMDARDARQVREVASRQFNDPKQFLARVREIWTSAPTESFDVLELADGRVVERYSKVQRVDNRSVGRVWTFRDITERRRTEEKLQAAKLAAEKASQAKDDFLALLSHELRTPLTPALAAASYLAEHENLPVEFREEISAIWRNVQLEARLIDDLLDLTRIARGKIEVQLEAVDAHRLLHNALSFVQEDVVDKQLEVVTKLSAREHSIWADPIRIQQVFWNLINNAVKFTPKGGRLTIASANEGNQFVCEFTDTGIGIDPEHHALIFNAFEQGERSITRRFGGLGLGLAVAKTVLDLHGGAIAVKSEGKNRGTSFKVSLGLSEKPVIEQTRTRGDGGVATKALRLLLVDDHADTRMILGRLLTRAGHKVSSAENAQAALSLLDAQRFDVLVSDIGLPDSSGDELLRAAKLRQPLKSIALSGFGMKEDIRRSLDAGFDFHLTKPIDFHALAATLQQMG